MKRSIGLVDSLAWLQKLKFLSLEKRIERTFLNKVVSFINDSDLLPNKCIIENITSSDVTFKDSNGCEVSAQELSDGFRSLLSFIFDLLRRLSMYFGKENIFNNNVVGLSGIVIVDEIDAHLHPMWQRRIGHWFVKHFPNMQFIVSTHSPLVCQAAEHGTIFRMPRAGSGEVAKMVRGEEFKRLVFGNVLEAYGTEVFGSEMASTQSKHSKQMHNELAKLNVKEITDGLDTAESNRQTELRSMMPSMAADLDTAG